MFLAWNGCSALHCRLDRAKTGGVLDQAQVCAHGIRHCSVTAYIKRDDRAVSLQLTLGRGMGRMCGETRKACHGDARVLSEPLGEDARALLCPLQA